MWTLPKVLFQNDIGSLSHSDLLQIALYTEISVIVVVETHGIRPKVEISVDKDSRQLTRDSLFEVVDIILNYYRTEMKIEINVLSDPHTVLEKKWVTVFLYGQRGVVRKGGGWVGAGFW